MTLRMRQQSMSAPPSAGRSAMYTAPELKPSVDWRILASQERRHATAKLRQEWLTSRQPEDRPDIVASSSNWPTVDMRKLLEFKKKLRHAQRSKQKETDRREEIETTAPMTGTWAGEVAKRNLVDRPSFVIKIPLDSPPNLRTVHDHPVNRKSVFQRAPAALPKRQGDRRIHFIDTEWCSECASWEHFNTNSTEFQKRSWIE